MSALAEPWMDELEVQLSAAAGRVTTRRVARRRNRRVATLAVGAVLLIGGGALAETAPFHPIASFQGLVGAQRAKTPADAVPQEVQRWLGRVRLYGLESRETRLMATFAGDARLYAAPTRTGKLCLVLVLDSGGGAMTCGGKLGPGVPVMAVILVARPGAGPVLAGLARDDVRALVMHAGGAPLTVQVHNGAFFYRGAPLTGIGRFTPVFG